MASTACLAHANVAAASLICAMRCAVIARRARSNTSGSSERLLRAGEGMSDATAFAKSYKVRYEGFIKEL